MRKFNARKLAVAATVVAIAIGASACYSGNQDGPKTAFIGDSITALSATAIGDAVGGTYAYNIVATPGDTILQGEAELTTALTDSQGPPVNAVVNLGTNDALQQNANWHTDYNNLISELQPVRCVILMTVVPVLDYNQPIPIASQLNEAIAATVAQNPGHFYELDWGTYATENAATLLSPTDAVHPTAAGQAAIAFFDDLALNNCPSSG